MKDEAIADWLPGWTVFVRPIGKQSMSIYELYLHECRLMQHSGWQLFERGALPIYAGTPAGPKLQSGTGGNFAARNRIHAGRFVVTASGTHKGRLKPEDFVEVLGINWKKKHLTVRRNSGTALPSTDSLLVAAAFAANPNISAWVHFHEPLKTSCSVRLNYPCMSHDDVKLLTQLITEGSRIINMIDHNLYIKIRPDGTADSAIVLDNTIRGAFAKVLKALSLRE